MHTDIAVVVALGKVILTGVLYTADSGAFDSRSAGIVDLGNDEAVVAACAGKVIVIVAFCSIVGERSRRRMHRTEIGTVGILAPEIVVISACLGKLGSIFRADYER